MIFNIEKIILFIVLLSILVVLHELGHFVLARANRVRVLEFAVGMGPLLAGYRSKRSGTLYSLRALPIGGYCAMYGEDNKTSEAEQQREYRDALKASLEDDNFQAKGAWRRLGIVAAGPIANFLLALVILFIGAIAFGVQSDRVQPLVGPLTPNMPAQRAGLRAGDRILAVNGRAIHSGLELVTLIHHSPHKVLSLRYERGGVVSTVSVTPVNCPPPERTSYGCIGFAPVAVFARVGLREALRASVQSFALIGQQTFGSLAMLVSHPAKYGSQVSGVVGMGQAAMTIEDFGWGPYLFFAALISFALGVFNLLPLPALDGGRAAFIIAEVIRGKPVDPEKEALVHITGFAVLIALMLVINFYNVVQIYQGKGPF